MTVDHLVKAADAPTMAALLAPLGLATVAQDGSIAWAPNVILNVGGPNDQSIRVILADAVWDKSDPDPHNWTITTPEMLEAGFFIMVAEAALDARLVTLPGNALRMATDRDAAAAGNPNFIDFLAVDFDQALLTTARIEPTPLGSNYPFKTMS